MASSSLSSSMLLRTPFFDLGSDTRGRWVAFYSGILHRHFNVSAQLGDLGGVDKGSDTTPLSGFDYLPLNNMADIDMDALHDSI